MKLARVLKIIGETDTEDTNNAANASTPRGMRVLVQPLNEHLKPVGDAHPAWNQFDARQDEIVVLDQSDPASSDYGEEQSTRVGSVIVVGVVDSIEVLARENTEVEKRRA